VTKQYVVSPLAPFPKRWRAGDGRSFRVICEPSEGYVMARFPRAVPFVLSVKEIHNAARCAHRFGPFECEEDPRQ
jgi:hypothetical protein